MNTYNIRLKENQMLLLLLLPSLIGFLAFYIIPFSLSLYLSLIDNSVSKTFVGLYNFKAVLSNGAFLLAIKNTLIFLSIYMPINIVLPLFMALMVERVNKYARGFFTFIFMLPIVIPTSSIIFFWRSVFSINGMINGIFFRSSPIDFLNTDYAILIIVLIFTWKNAGYNMILYLAGLNFIPKSFYEFAKVEGSREWDMLSRITIPSLMPTVLLVFVMSIINSFQSFKEIYLLSGAYPHKSIYMIQHFMNNQFQALDYQKLASASYILSVLFVLMAFFLLRYQNKSMGKV